MEHCVIEIMRHSSQCDWYSAKIGMILKVYDSGDNEFYTLKIKDKRAKYIRKSDTITLKNLSQFKNRPVINFDAITDREIEFIKLTWDGLNSAEIGAVMFLSKRTIDGYRSNVYDKTGCKNIIAMIRYALKNKIIEL